MSILPKTGVTLAGLALALIAPATHAAPATTFSNFGSGNTFNINLGWGESGPTSSYAANNGTYYSQGEGFIPAFSGTLSTISIALSLNVDDAAGTNDAHLFLTEDSGGVPGAVLESFTLTNLPSNHTSYTPDLLISSVHPLLTAGNTYFLYEAETGNEDNTWNFNTLGETGPHTYSRGGNPFSTFPANQGAFSVQVDALPEASPAVSFGLLLALGLGAGAAVAVRKKAASPV